MQLIRHPENPILIPTPHSWEKTAVMNASVIKDQNAFHMLYRALGVTSQTFPSGKTYHQSTIGYAKSTDGIHFARHTKPFIFPEESWEALGCEDPRITKLADTYYIFYTAVSKGTVEEKDVKIACATTKDFQTYKKFGPIDLAGRCKAAALFPEKIYDKFAFLYTQHADRPESTISIVFVDSIKQIFDKDAWKNVKKAPLLTPSQNAFRGPELGAVPLKTDKGWLFIYCPESFKKEWTIGALLLDLQNPTKIIGRTEAPLLQPEKDYEIKGYVNNVTFPSGAVIVGNELFVYYGGGDSGVCFATCTLSDLLSSLK